MQTVLLDAYTYLMIIYVYCGLLAPAFFGVVYVWLFPFFLTVDLQPTINTLRQLTL